MEWRRGGQKFARSIDAESMGGVRELREGKAFGSHILRVDGCRSTNLQNASRPTRILPYFAMKGDEMYT